MENDKAGPAQLTPEEQQILKDLEERIGKDALNHFAVNIFLLEKHEKQHLAWLRSVAKMTDAEGLVLIKYAVNNPDLKRLRLSMGWKMIGIGIAVTIVWVLIYDTIFDYLIPDMIQIFGGMLGALIAGIGMKFVLEAQFSICRRFENKKKIEYLIAAIFLLGVVITYYVISTAHSQL